MEPVYVRDEWWFFRAFGSEFGPFDTEDDAWDAYQDIMSGDCPTCGD